MLREGSVFVLRNKKGKEFGVQFKPLKNSMAARLEAYLATKPDLGKGGEAAEEVLEILAVSNSNETSATITDRESAANAGAAEPMQVCRARTKIRVWPSVGDSRAIRVGCKLRRAHDGFSFLRSQGLNG